MWKMREQIKVVWIMSIATTKDIKFGVTSKSEERNSWYEKKTYHDHDKLKVYSDSLYQSKWIRLHYAQADHNNPCIMKSVTNAHNNFPMIWKRNWKIAF